MKITIFPNIKAFPTQKEKHYEATKAIKGEIVEIKDLKELSGYISKYAWSPSVFTDTRKSSNFVSTGFITLDIDQDMRIEEANAILKYLRWSYLIATTTNHQKNKNGIICDRFRIIVPTEQEILNSNDFKLNWDNLTKYFPADPSCRDVARFYFGCQKGYIYDNRLFKVETNKVKKATKSKTKKNPARPGKLSSRTMKFLQCNGKTDNWHQEFLFAARDLKAQGYDFFQSEEILTKVTGYLDEKHDIAQLRYVYEDNSIEFEYREF